MSSLKTPTLGPILRPLALLGGGLLSIVIGSSIANNIFKDDDEPTHSVNQVKETSIDPNDLAEMRKSLFVLDRIDKSESQRVEFERCLEETRQLIIQAEQEAAEYKAAVERYQSTVKELEEVVKDPPQGQEDKN